MMKTLSDLKTNSRAASLVLFPSRHQKHILHLPLFITFLFTLSLVQSQALSFPTCASFALNNVPSPRRSFDAKTRRKGLSHRLVEKRDASARWEAQFQQLLAFQRQHGHVNVPQLPTKNIPGNHQKLATFCRNLRTQYKYYHDPKRKHLSYLTVERIARLEEIGFVWNSHDASWMSKFHDLTEFYAQNGHCNVPRNENSSLSTWCIKQRQYYRTNSLKMERIKLLESINFRFDPQNESWWHMYSKLKQFQGKHGHLNVPRSYDQRLYQWILHQRRLCREYVLAFELGEDDEDESISGLDDDRLKALRMIQFCWLPDPERPVDEIPEDIFAWKSA